MMLSTGPTLRLFAPHFLIAPPGRAATYSSRTLLRFSSCVMPTSSSELMGDEDMEDEDDAMPSPVPTAPILRFEPRFPFLRRSSVEKRHLHRGHPIDDSNSRTNVSILLVGVGIFAEWYDSPACLPFEGPSWSDSSELRSDSAAVLLTRLLMKSRSRSHVALQDRVQTSHFNCLRSRKWNSV